jgi:hypothetical protein
VIFNAAGFYDALAPEKRAAPPQKPEKASQETGGHSHRAKVAEIWQV